ncbi:hypothetical protein HRbin15_00729 [bacterium HR15]|nr:hypothetical protein HRbin15_00729 [bacterium HR15]
MASRFYPLLAFWHTRFAHWRVRAKNLLPLHYTLSGTANARGIEGVRNIVVQNIKFWRLINRNGRVYIDGIEGFWSYAKERLMPSHGLPPQWFPYPLKELEFRYNHREEDLYDLLLRLLKVE